MKFNYSLVILFSLFYNHSSLAHDFVSLNPKFDYNFYEDFFKGKLVLRFAVWLIQTNKKRTRKFLIQHIYACYDSWFAYF